MAAKQEITKTTEPALPVADKPAFDAQAYLDELVPVTLFYDGKEYKNRLHVRINDKRWSIKRGVEVPIPRRVKYIIDDQIKMDMAAQMSANAAEEAYKQHRV